MQLQCMTTQFTIFSDVMLNFVEEAQQQQQQNSNHFYMLAERWLALVRFIFHVICTSNIILYAFYAKQMSARFRSPQIKDYLLTIAVQIEI